MDDKDDFLAVLDPVDDDIDSVVDAVAVAVVVVVVVVDDDRRSFLSFDYKEHDDNNRLHASSKDKILCSYRT